MDRVAQPAYRIPPLSRADKTRREKQEPSQAEIIILAQNRAEIDARHQRQAAVPVKEQLSEEQQIAQFNRQMDSIGHVGAVLAAICGIAVMAAQVAMWMGR